MLSRGFRKRHPATHWRWRSESGDTLVEVLLATVIISIVIAAGFQISNAALRVNQTSQERTEVANKMRDQVERVRFLGKVAINAGTSGGNEYYIQTSNNSIQNASEGPPVTDAASDLFYIYFTVDKQINYTDVTVHAKWTALGSQGQQTSGLVYRLTE